MVDLLSLLPGRELPMLKFEFDLLLCYVAFSFHYIGLKFEVQTISIPDYKSKQSAKTIQQLF